MKLTTILTLNLKPYDLTITIDIGRYAKSETRPIMIAHEFINYEMEIDLKNPYVPFEEGVIGMLDERDDATDNDPIEEVDNMQIGK
jgi:hypothetical protein